MIDSPLDHYMSWRDHPEHDSWVVNRARRAINLAAAAAFLGPAVGLHVAYGVHWLGGALVGAPLAYLTEHLLMHRLYRRVLAARNGGGR